MSESYYKILGHCFVKVLCIIFLNCQAWTFYCMIPNYEYLQVRDHHCRYHEQLHSDDNVWQTFEENIWRLFHNSRCHSYQCKSRQRGIHIKYVERQKRAKDELGGVSKLAGGSSLSAGPPSSTPPRLSWVPPSSVRGALWVPRVSDSAEWSFIFRTYLIW